MVKKPYLISNKLKLGGGQTAENWLIYDYFYSGYMPPGYDDGLRVEISTDCGRVGILFMEQLDRTYKLLHM